MRLRNRTKDKKPRPEPKPRGGYSPTGHFDLAYLPKGPAPGGEPPLPSDDAHEVSSSAS